MKLSLNGALTIGTEDGANIEIRDQVGADNIFIFGNNTAQVAALRQEGYHPNEVYHDDPVLKEALDKIDGGFFSPGDRPRYHDVFNCLVHYGDHYQLLADYADYVATQQRVDALYLTPTEWQRKAILNVAVGDACAQAHLATLVQHYGAAKKAMVVGGPTAQAGQFRC
ncbi:glycogen/starch/alpha-glucan phosphorylase [Candidatus Accumulibacter vicinus]|uniref:Alpha-1,4 glucan phosphorylase n=1 Tax=Candidatus Accumulibacter vicinus TaxID=2954382 RepID=A0A084Y439_9PROT|nr:MAG: Maltodextrin phosphorylase [Candidatus Accumulibacter vicinus]